MSFSTVSVSSDYMDESVGSSASYVILLDSEAAVDVVPVIVPKVASKAEAAVVASPSAILDLVLESDIETEPSEAPPSPAEKMTIRIYLREDLRSRLLCE
nr:hypothetical protein [Tanacetum cinerariifolium]